MSKNKKEVDSITAPPLNSNNKAASQSASEATNNKKNASIFARLFARPSKSQEETKALNNSKPGVSNPPPPTVPEHKGTDLVNENVADDLFELIEKESADLMEPLKN